MLWFTYIGPTIRMICALNYYKEGEEAAEVRTLKHHSKHQATKYYFWCPNYLTDLRTASQPETGHLVAHNGPSEAMFTLLKPQGPCSKQHRTPHSVRQSGQNMLR